MKIHKFKRTSLWRRIHPSYAKPGGFAVLKDEPRKWRYLNGFGFQFRKTHYWIEFRNY